MIRGSSSIRLSRQTRVASTEAGVEFIDPVDDRTGVLVLNAKSQGLASRHSRLAQSPRAAAEEDG